MSRCRFCHEYTDNNDTVRFGPRHYAHWQCYYDRKGVDGWVKLNPFNRGRTPLWLVRNNPDLRAVLDA